jgi:hypothetical protein
MARTSNSLAEKDLRSAMKAGTGNLLSMTWCLSTSDHTQRCLVTDEKRFDVCERVRDLVAPIEPSQSGESLPFLAREYLQHR